MPRDQQRHDEAVRITTAASSRNADIAARQKRYLLSMSLRSACFVGAVLTSILGGPPVVVGILIAGALVLPYIAVVMANAASSRTDDFALLGAGQGPAQLTGPAPTDPEG